MIRTFTHTGARIAAGLAVAAAGFGLLPMGSAHAGDDLEADWMITSSCEGGFHWILQFENMNSDAVEVELYASGGNYHRAMVAGHTMVTWTVYDDEGFASTAYLNVEGTEVDREELSGIVDCVQDGEVTASISVDCPDEVGGDIFVRYDFAAPGTGAKFEFDTPDGGTDGLTVADEVTFRTRIVTQGQAVNVSIRDITDGESVVATFDDTIDCPTPVIDEGGEDNADSDEGGEGSGAGLPDTGSETTLAWLAAGALVAGFGVLRLARREEELAEEFAAE